MKGLEPVSHGHQGRRATEPRDNEGFLAEGSWHMVTDDSQPNPRGR
jgi:hypothetical protein